MFTVNLRDHIKLKKKEELKKARVTTYKFVGARHQLKQNS
jgi:hypothetical protein